VPDPFQGDLLSGERVLWTGQPDPTRIFSAGDIFLVPFSLMWGGFAIFWEASVLGLVFPTPRNATPALFMVLWGIPFVLVGLYMIVGQFFVKRWRRRNTTYAVTTQRALIATRIRQRQVQAALLDTIPVINKTVRSDGSGTIVFGNSNWTTSMYQDSGMDFFGRASSQPCLVFSDIPHVNMVFDLVSRARQSPR